MRSIFVDPNYILIFLKSPHFIETGTSKMTGTAGQKRVPFEYFAYSPFPLLNELMLLCDRLEAARAERELTRDRLTSAAWPASMHLIQIPFARMPASHLGPFRSSARELTKSRSCVRRSSTSPFAGSLCRRSRTTNRQRDC